MHSHTLFFGERWDAPIVDEARQVETPVGQPCYACTEAVADGDRGFIRAVGRMVDGELRASPEAVHAECDLRSVMGHRVGICDCTGYDDNRETARLVWQRAGEQRGRPLEERCDER